MKKIQTVPTLCVLAAALFFVLVSCAAPSVAPLPPSDEDAAEQAVSPSDSTAPATDQGTAASPQPEWKMAAPRICDPENARYSPLRSDAFWNQRIEDAEAVAYAKIEYSNEMKQRFDIFVYGDNSEEGRNAISQYVNEAEVCLEAIEDNPDAGILYTSAEMDELLAESTLEEPIPVAVGEDYVYSNEWEEFLAQSPGSLVIWFGLTIPDMLNAVGGWDRLVLAAMAGSGNDLDPVLVVELRDYAATIQPQFEEQIFRTDQAEFVSWFVFEFSQIYATIHFSFDPSIAATANGGTINYKAWCNKKSARLNMTSQFNEPEVSFWKIDGLGYWNVPVPQGETFDNILVASPDNTASFDAVVRGGASASQYTISGGWVQGSGCR